MKKTKLNANVVGADSISAQKGITLIALIITIIVMLILVGVTVNVAINGGLFSTAKYAKEQTILESERDQLTGFALGKYNTQTGEITIEDSDMSELEGWTKSEDIYTSPNGNQFTIGENGEVEVYEVPWYELTDAEKEEITAIDGASEIGDDYEYYYIAYSEEGDYQYIVGLMIADGCTEIALVKNERVTTHTDEWNESGALVYYAETSGEFAETLESLGVESNTWYYAPRESWIGRDGTAKYSGDVSDYLPSSSESYTFVCQSALDRIIASFN